MAIGAQKSSGCGPRAPSSLEINDNSWTVSGALWCHVKATTSSNLLLHDPGGVGPGPQRVPHIPVPVVEAGQVHVGVDVLVVVMVLGRTHGLRGQTDEGKKKKVNPALKSASVSNGLDTFRPLA